MSRTIPRGIQTTAHVSTLPPGRSAYSNDGCRCDGCRDDWADYCLDLRRGRAERPEFHPFTHGTVNGYTNYACRCDECRRANSDQSRLRRQAVS